MSQSEKPSEAPTPRLKGYGAAYRSQLEQEFLGDDGKAAMHRAPTVLRAAISEMLRAIENLRAAQSARAAIIEECAKVCDSRAAYWAQKDAKWDREAEAVLCADAIRALASTTKREGE